VNYIHGTPRWCVSIALVAGGDIVSGVINAPDERRLFTARRGHGAFLNGAPIRVSNLASRCLAGGGNRLVAAAAQSRHMAQLIQRLIGDGIEFRRLGSGALGVADTAAG
jgi:myo-inositol-1(or 4)-monophosphatase